MLNPKPIALTTDSSEGRAETATGCRLINVYAEAVPTSKKTPAVLIGAPGHSLFALLPTLPVYGAHLFDGMIYAVTATNLYKVAFDGSYSDLGPVIIKGKVWMANNGIHVGFVDGFKGYYYHPDTGINEWSGEGWYQANTIVCHDERFIFNRKGSGQFFRSGLLDITLDPLDFDTAESVSDNLLGVFSDIRYILLLGAKTIEIWYNSGDLISPYEKIQGGVIDKGCAAIHATAKTGNSVYWLGDDGTVYRLSGYTPQRVSTHAVETDIKKGVISDAEAFTYVDEGHSWYVITFPSQKKTWAFDSTTGLWSERQHKTQGRILAQCYAKFNDSTHLVGDFQSGAIYMMNLDAYTDDGTEILRVVEFSIGSPVVMTKGISIEADVLRGVGTVSGDGHNPQMVFSWSNDSKKTWGNEHSRSMGGVGVKTSRVKVNRIGAFFQRFFRISIAEPVKVIIEGIYLTAKR